jgi:hypothetical protein
VEERQVADVMSVDLMMFCRITHTVILDDPFDDPHGLPIPDCSPEPSAAALMVSTPWL